MSNTQCMSQDVKPVPAAAAAAERRSVGGSTSVIAPDTQYNAAPRLDTLEWPVCAVC